MGQCLAQHLLGLNHQPHIHAGLTGLVTRGRRHKLEFGQVALKVNAHAGQHLLHVKRLANVVHCTSGKACQAFGQVVGRGQKNHGDGTHGRVGLELPAGGNAVHAGHVHVHQDQAGLEQDGLLVTALAAESHAHAQVFEFHHVHQHAQVRHRIVDQQHVGLDGLVCVPQ